MEKRLLAAMKASSEVMETLFFLQKVGATLYVT